MNTRLCAGFTFFFLYLLLDAQNSKAQSTNSPTRPTSPPVKSAPRPSPTPPAASQPPPSTGSMNSGSSSRYFESVRALRQELYGKIKESRAIDEDILYDDSPVVGNSMEDLEEEFDKKGFSFEDLEKASLVSWYKLRTKTLAPNQTLRQRDFMNEVRHSGLFMISSEPDRATIQVDAFPWPEQTKAALWVTTGKCRIRITKEGFLPFEKTYEVKELDVVNVRAKLEKVK